MSATVRIDPRIRARRIAVAREQGRRRLRMLGVAVAVIALCVLAWAASRSPLFDVDRIEIDGLGPSQTEVALASSGLERGTPLLDVDIGGATEAIRALAWVREVSVTRDWPGAIRVEIEPRLPVAVIGTGTDRAVLDGDGVVIARADAPDPTGLLVSADDLPTIAAPGTAALGATHPATGPGLAIATALPADLGPWLDHVAVLGDGTVELRLLGGVRVDLGAPGPMDDRLQALRSVLGVVELGCIESISVAIADQPVVRRSAACLAPAPAETGESSDG